MRVTPTLGNSNKPRDLPEDCSKTVQAAQRCLGQPPKIKGDLKQHRFSREFPPTSATKLMH